MKSTHVKVFFALIVVTCFCTSMYFFNFNKILLELKSRQRVNNTSESINRLTSEFISIADVGKRKPEIDPNTKYILMWTLNSTVPFIYLKQGYEIFISEDCEYQNCFFTNDREFFDDIKKFDALVFHGPEYTWKHNHRNLGYPEERGENQKYVYTCFESSDNYPVCDKKFNDYFNWTWTYRSDGDVKWGYVDIKDLEGNIIGPKPNMHWMENMRNITSEQKESLKSKTKIAAWFVSNCNTKSGRENFVRRLEKSLNSRGFSIDVYGNCGKFKCPRDEESRCFELIKKDYFFYLSFENSLCEDYVTEKLLHALKNWAVPIVWGGANYSRFMPPGSYFNAKEFQNPDELADRMIELMQNMDEYSTYFRWKNYYKYQRDIETPDTRASCRLCKALNDPAMMSNHKSYKNFVEWWDGDSSRYCR